VSDSARVTDCLFCRIVAGEIPATVVSRGDGFLAFEDIAPKAPVHLLVIPERHVDSIADVASLDADARAAMMSFVVAVAIDAGLEDSGYRITTNHGPDARQSVSHLHWHVMGGTRLSDTM
jgi:histidine triad (HIT) family protein